MKHEDIDHTGLTGVGGGTPDAHAASHENGGSDEIDVTGLTGAGGGGSTAQQNYDAGAAPGSPSAQDDEFDTPGASPAGTRVNSGTVKGTWAVRDGAAVFTHTVTATTELDVWVQARTVSVGDYVQAAFIYPGNGTQYVHPTIGFANGNTYGAGAQVIATTHWTGFQSRHMLNAFTNYSTRGSDGTIYDGHQLGSHPQYVRVKYEAANTWGYYVSLDGVNWRAVQSNYSSTMTPTHVFFGAGLFSSPTYTAANGQGFRIEYFRVNAA